VLDLREMSVDEIAEVYKKMYKAGIKAAPEVYADFFKFLFKIMGILLIISASCFALGGILNLMAFLFS
jgi:hypothetical protein